jgi:diguanylate cyclase (GGDEF)-like protein
MGGDDFLTKPIHPEFLISSVGIKAERMRAMRRLMARDNLTGLLNLANIEEQLEMSLVRAKKNNTPCAFAILELDDFNAVNDKHGYLTGDRVIVLTSLLLKRRIRATDVAGRYGGRKFAVIMPGTDAETAVSVMDEVRASFARILHDCHQGEFYLTLSCGIAVYPQSGDVASLNRAAVDSLSAAKGKGKNRVETAGR